MKALIACPLAAGESTASTSGTIRYRPSLRDVGNVKFAACLRWLKPKFLIVDRLPHAEILTLWRNSVSEDKRLLVLVIGAEGNRNRPQAEKVPGVEVVLKSEIVNSQSAAELLTMLEELWVLERKHRSSTAPAQSVSRDERGRILLVGAGIVNLVTAAALVEDGWDVELFDAGPPPGNGEAWQRYGATHGGEDARIFSLNETRNHHYKGLREQANVSYRRSVSEGGWLLRHADNLTSADLEWRDEFESVPAWLRQKHDREIVAFNQESWLLWREIKRQAPELFSDSGCRERLYRAYCSDEQFYQGVEDEKRIGSFKRVLAESEVREELPALAVAHAQGNIRHFIEVVGFSVQIHRLARSLIESVEKRGGRFQWNQTAVAVEKNANGEVSGIQFPGDVVRADHYVISPGALAGDRFLHDLGLWGKIGQVVGVWLTLPNDSPSLNWPLKVARRGFASPGAVEGANVIPVTDSDGRAVIHLGAGYGHLGTSGEAPSISQLRPLSQALHETAEQLFPDHYAKANASKHWRSAAPRYCIRPWTPTCLGIFGALPAERGGRCIVTGGHNSGGFAQSPSVASAVLAEIHGRDHAMHTRYHPDRTREFLRLFE